MSEALDKARAAEAERPAAAAGAPAKEARAPICFVVDGEGSIRHFLSLILHGAGIDTQEFSDGASFRASIGRHAPDIVFLDIGLESAETIESVIALGKRGFAGYVQLMSNRGAAVLEHVKSVGEQQKLVMLDVLKKPFDTSAVVKIVQEIKLGHAPAVAARVSLTEAIKNNWMEFWYQPKIDLRKKQLAGVEVFARARHPQYGVIMPGAFMPGATESELSDLAHLSVEAALLAGIAFGKVGVNLRMSVNVPVTALVKMSIPDLVRKHRPTFDSWPGMIIDVTEEQIVTDLPLASAMAKKLSECRVKLAIDDFGRGYSSLTRLKELPFAELKLDRSFVTDCGTDKVNAPLCKTVIDLAHNFGSAAVAIGIEKASDAVALVSMGCDFGQGFLLGQPMPLERFTSLLRQRAAGQAPKPAAAKAS